MSPSPSKGRIVYHSSVILWRSWNKKYLTHWVTEWQGHLLSCPRQLESPWVLDTFWNALSLFQPREYPIHSIGEMQGLEKTSTNIKHIWYKYNSNKKSNKRKLILYSYTPNGPSFPISREHPILRRNARALDMHKKNKHMNKSKKIQKHIRADVTI